MKRKIPISYFLIFALLVFGLAYLYMQFVVQKEEQLSYSPLQPAAAAGLKVERLKGYDYIHPLLMVERDAKSESYNDLLQEVSTYIESQKQNKTINSASFYFRDLSQTEWTGYNEDEKFWPASLMKVPEMISLLRQEEDQPGLLDKKLDYKAPYIVDKNPVFKTKQLQPGSTYTMRELLRYMISYSDNNATILLDNHLNQKVFSKLLADLSLPPLDAKAANYPLSAKEASYFFRLIFNSSYLSIPHSEYAAELLSTTEFKAGFSAGLPSNIKIIHKFGEAGDPGEHQLHETAIIYVNDNPYLLTVMTKGPNLKKLPEILKSIASIVYRRVANS